MPPALSDEENGASSGASSSEEEIPHHDAKETTKETAKDVDGKDGEEDEEEIAEDEYVVEKIMQHRFDDEGNIEYNVKWQGYEKKSDRTWEPEENLATAIDVLNEYFQEIGGRPEPVQKGKKRKGRKSIANSEAASTPASTTKRVKKDKEQEWSPPPGSWENDVNYVDTVEESLDPKTGNLTRYAYLVWANGKKTQHPLAHVYHKCPQKMLIYYESHLVFTHSGDDDVNGDHDTSMKEGI